MLGGVWIGTGIGSLGDGLPADDWADDFVYGPVCIAFGVYLDWVNRRDVRRELALRDLRLKR